MMKAVIFDMDGVIVDTMNMHWSASSEIFSREGLSVPKKEMKKFDTMRTNDAFKLFFPAKSDKEIDRLVSEKYSLLEKKVSGIKPIPGFLEFFFKIKGKYPIALVSSSRTGFIEFILNEIGERNSFNAIFGAESVSKGKPDPEGYLKAAKSLGFKPAECLVIEDSIFGIKSAKKAGCKCIAVTNTYDRNFLLDADLIVDSLKELSIKKVEALFNA
ncbi:MAG TPA: HAD family phosphatase [archaeon]|nr:HAD family phosphatase [archaeon]